MRASVLWCTAHGLARDRRPHVLPLSVRSACRHNVSAPVRHDVLLTYIEGTLGDELHKQNDRRALRYRANRDSEQVIIVKFSARRRTRCMRSC